MTFSPNPYTERVYFIRTESGRWYATNVKSEITEAREAGLEVTAHPTRQSTPQTNRQSAQQTVLL